MSDARDIRLPEHLYLHVPFCRAKCAYCDFYSLGGPLSDERVTTVFRKLSRDLSTWAELHLPGTLSSIYVGGGTPSLVAEQVAELLGCVRRLLPVADNAEVTVESNPDSLSEEAARQLVSAGATRISVGVQSFDDGLLRLLGRVHDAAQARAACATVIRSGAMLSVDLICAIPGQTMRVWRDTLESAIEAGARHVSVYPLSVEEGTPLASAIACGALEEPDPDLAADMMIAADEILAEAGLLRYEIANYAAPGFESVHNSAYWTGKPYIGLGPAAHGMLDSATAEAARARIGGSSAFPPDTARIRYANPPDIETWLAGEASCVEALTEPECQREDLMLGMRLRRGVAEEDVRTAHLEAVFAGLVADGLAERYRDERGCARIRATQRGWLLGNQVFGRIWTAPWPCCDNLA